MNAKNDNTSWFFMGFLLVLLSFLPYAILGGNSYISVHDQLDGEVIAYILSAKHLLQDYIPEFMNGASSTALTCASPLTLLFYLSFPPLYAFLINYLFVAIVSYIGMYLCLNEFFNKPWMSATIAVIFVLLPFLSVYGLSVMGQPLLLYACVCLYKNKHIIIEFVLIALFACFSSLVLVGFADLILLTVFTIYLIWKRSHAKKYFVISIFLLGGLYVLFNFNLLTDFLQAGAFKSHKNELVLGPSSMIYNFLYLLYKGHYAAESWHFFILIGAVFVVSVILINYKAFNVEYKRYLNGMIFLLGSAILIAGFYALWQSGAIAKIRNHIGGFATSFQVDRFYWLYPCIWFLLLGFTVFFIRSPAVRIKYFNNKLVRNATTIILLISVTINVYASRTSWPNMIKLLSGQSITSDSLISWNEFYSQELFEDIQNYIGKPLSDYKVASVNMHPAVALYNGFYCIDGYSNNYSLDYKHEFREIIAKELEKNTELKSYYDNWGNRCYLFVDQTPFGYYYNFGDTVLTDLELDTIKLKLMGCDYLLSANPIESPFMPNLDLLKDFTSEKSPYHIYLYQITE